jgi:hypothetical protein
METVPTAWLLIGHGTYPFLVLTTWQQWQLILGEIDLLEMLETAGWCEGHAEPVVHERGHTEPGEERHLADARGNKGDRATGCGQSAVGPHGSSVKKYLLASAKANNLYDDARDVYRVRAEQESVSALFLQVMAGEEKPKQKAPPQ